jgi:H+/Cl- antiporter ClcA
MEAHYLNISLLAKLILAHLLADFVFQTRSMVNDRFENKWRSRWLYIHGVLAGLLAYILSGAFTHIWLFTAYTISHILIDGFKSTRKDDLKWFALDQMAMCSLSLRSGLQ